MTKCTKCDKEFDATVDEFGELPEMCEDCQISETEEVDPLLVTCQWCGKRIDDCNCLDATEVLELDLD